MPDHPTDDLERIQTGRRNLRRGGRVAHKILVAAFQVLQRAVVLADLSADGFDRDDKHRTAKRLVCHFDALGYNVLLRPRTATA